MTPSLPLIEKYRAKKFDDIRGQDLAIEEVRNFFRTFPKKRALILAGPVGTGKTSLAIALANEYNLELFELNASDLRNRLKLEEVLKPSIEQQSLFKKGKIILMDEADGITASDRGGLPELIALITKTSFPIIITANDIYDKKFSLLRQKCKIVQVKELKPNSIIEIINNVLRKEKRKVALEILNLIVKKSKGDVRAALNDLQTVLNIGEEVLILELSKKEKLDSETEIIEISEREKQESIFDALKKVFQFPTNKETINVYDPTQTELDEIILWVEENIPQEYQGKALAKAYESLSKADIFKGRIYRQQYYRFLVYENFFLSAGISASTKLKSNKFTPYKRPSRILKIWLANQKNQKKKSIAMKYARFSHMSKRKAMKENFLFPFIIDESMKKELDLDDNELDYLKEKKEAVLQRMS